MGATISNFRHKERFEEQMVEIMEAQNMKVTFFFDQR